MTGAGVPNDQPPSLVPPPTAPRAASGKTLSRCITSSLRPCLDVLVRCRTVRESGERRREITLSRDEPGQAASGKAPTMLDVAALAGVSLKTVSRVVNQAPNVAPELVTRVLDAIRLLDYRPNLTASSLRRADRKTAAIGLLLEDVANPFSSALHRAVEDVARERGSLVFAGSSDEDGDRERELLLALVARRVDGLIAVPCGDNDGGLLREQRLGRPMVVVDRLVASGDADTVTVDNRGGAQRAVRHLAAHGHRRIGRASCRER